MGVHDTIKVHQTKKLQFPEFSTGLPEIVSAEGPGPHGSADGVTTVEVVCELHGSTLLVSVCGADEAPQGSMAAVGIVSNKRQKC